MKRNKICGALALAYFVTNVALAYSAEANFWTERRRSALPASAFAGFSERSSSSTLIFSPSIGRGLSADFLEAHGELLQTLPPAHGSVLKISIPTRFSQQGPVIIHIQDVHQNLEAQRHIASVVTALAGRVDIIGLEGSTRTIDLARFRAFPDRKAMALVAEESLAQNEITGPIYAGLTSTEPFPPLLGIDDANHYAAHIEAYRQSMTRVTEQKIVLEKIKLSLEKEKQQALNPALLSFDRSVGAYREGRTSLALYLKEIATKRHPLPLNVRRYVDSLAMENMFDIQTVDQERTRAMERLFTRLNVKELSQYTAQVNAYRMGAMRSGDFYAKLKDLCQKNHIPLGKSLDIYVRYVLLADRVDASALLEELSALEQATYHRRAISPAETDFVSRSRRIFLTEKLVRFELTPAEWWEYATHPTPGLQSFESFYREAHARDGAMATNMMTALSHIHRNISPTPFFPMEGQRGLTGPVALLVTGGYHTPGLTERLTKAGATVISFVPKIERIAADHTPNALEVFTREKADLQILFEGMKHVLGQDPAPPFVTDLSLPWKVSLVSERDPNETFGALAPLWTKAQVRSVLKRDEESILRLKNGSARGKFDRNAPLGNRITTDAEFNQNNGATNIFIRLMTLLRPPRPIDLLISIRGFPIKGTLSLVAGMWVAAVWVAVTGNYGELSTIYAGAVFGVFVGSHLVRHFWPQIGLSLSGPLHKGTMAFGIFLIATVTFDMASKLILISYADPGFIFESLAGRGPFQSLFVLPPGFDEVVVSSRLTPLVGNWAVIPAFHVKSALGTVMMYSAFVPTLWCWRYLLRCSPKISGALGIYLGGVLGNLTNVLLWGGAWDLLALLRPASEGISTPLFVFNFADLFQLLGIVLMGVFVAFHFWRRDRSQHIPSPEPWLSQSSSNRRLSLSFLASVFVACQLLFGSPEEFKKIEPAKESQSFHSLGADQRRVGPFRIRSIPVNGLVHLFENNKHHPLFQVPNDGRYLYIEVDPPSFTAKMTKDGLRWRWHPMTFLPPGVRERWVSMFSSPEVAQAAEILLGLAEGLTRQDPSLNPIVRSVWDSTPAVPQTTPLEKSAFCGLLNLEETLVQMLPLRTLEDRPALAVTIAPSPFKKRTETSTINADVSFKEIEKLKEPREIVISVPQGKGVSQDALAHARKELIPYFQAAREFGKNIDPNNMGSGRLHLLSHQPMENKNALGKTSGGNPLTPWKKLAFLTGGALSTAAAWAGECGGSVAWGAFAANGLVPIVALMMGFSFWGILGNRSGKPFGLARILPMGKTSAKSDADPYEGALQISQGGGVPGLTEKIVPLDIVSKEDLSGIASMLSRLDFINQRSKVPIHIVFAGETTVDVLKLQELNGFRGYVHVVDRPVAPGGVLDPAVLAEGMKELKKFPASENVSWWIVLSEGISVDRKKLNALQDHGLAGSVKRSLTEYIARLLKDKLKPGDLNTLIDMVALVWRSA